MARYQPRAHVEPTISRRTLAAHLQAAQFDVLHSDVYGVAEKVMALHAIANLARHLSAHWGRTTRFYGPASERMWYRLAGLDSEGMPSAVMVDRVSEVESVRPVLSEDHIVRGED